MGGRRRNLLLMGAVALAAAGLGAWVAGQRYVVGPADTEAARLLWSLELPQADGVPLRLGEFQGKVLVVNFWATWCPPCVREMPQLDRFHQTIRDRPGQVIGLAIDAPMAVREFLARIPVGFPIGLAGLEGTELMRQLGNDAGALPFTVMIDPRGQIAWRKLGETTMEELLARAERTR